MCPERQYHCGVEISSKAAVFKSGGSDGNQTPWIGVSLDEKDSRAWFSAIDNSNDTAQCQATPRNRRPEPDERQQTVQKSRVAPIGVRRIESCGASTGGAIDDAEARPPRCNRAAVRRPRASHVGINRCLPQISGDARSRFRVVFGREMRQGVSRELCTVDRTMSRRVIPDGYTDVKR